jgi:hypothetical protein
MAGTEFDPEADGFGRSREAYQTDHRTLQALIQALQGQIKALEGRVVALSSGGASTAMVERSGGSAVSTLPAQTLPHTHVLADITDLSGLSVTTSQVTGLAEFIQDTVGAMLSSTGGCTITYNDGAGTITISVP